MKKNEIMNAERYETPQAESIIFEVQKGILADSCGSETCGGETEVPDPICQINM